MCGHAPVTFICLTAMDVKVVNVEVFNDFFLALDVVSTFFRWKIFSQSRLFVVILFIYLYVIETYRVQ